MQMNLNLKDNRENLQRKRRGLDLARSFHKHEWQPAAQQQQNAHQRVAL